VESEAVPATLRSTPEPRAIQKRGMLGLRLRLRLRDDPSHNPKASLRESRRARSWAGPAISTVVFSRCLPHVPSPGAEGTEEGTQAVGREKTDGTRMSRLHAGPPDRVRLLPSSVASAPRRRPCRRRRQ